MAWADPEGGGGKGSGPPPGTLQVAIGFFGNSGTNQPAREAIVASKLFIVRPGGVL